MLHISRFELICQLINISSIESTNERNEHIMIIYTKNDKPYVLVYHQETLLMQFFRYCSNLIIKLKTFNIKINCISQKQKVNIMLTFTWIDRFTWWQKLTSWWQRTWSNCGRTRALKTWNGREGLWGLSCLRRVILRWPIRGQQTHLESTHHRS